MPSKNLLSILAIFHLSPALSMSRYLTAWSFHAHIYFTLFSVARQHGIVLRNYLFYSPRHWCNLTLHFLPRTQFSVSSYQQFCTGIRFRFHELQHWGHPPITRFFHVRLTCLGLHLCPTAFVSSQNITLSATGFPSSPFPCLFTFLLLYGYFLISNYWKLQVDSATCNCTHCLNSWTDELKSLLLFVLTSFPKNEGYLSLFN